MSLERQIRAHFVALAATVTGVAAALEYEPAELPAALKDGAVVTVLGMPPAQISTSTGMDTVTYSYRINVYVNLIQGYQEAQDALADVLEALLAKIRPDVNAGGLADIWRLSGTGQEPAFAHDEGWILQPLTLTAAIETV